MLRCLDEIHRGDLSQETLIFSPSAKKLSKAHSLQKPMTVCVLLMKRWKRGMAKLNDSQRVQRVNRVLVLTQQRGLGWRTRRVLSEQFLHPLAPGSQHACVLFRFLYGKHSAHNYTHSRLHPCCGGGVVGSKCKVLRSGELFQTGVRLPGSAVILGG